AAEVDEEPTTAVETADETDESTAVDTDESAAEAAEASDATDEVEPAEDEEEDPVEAFRRELRMLPGDWYVVHSYAGYENRVKANLESRIQSLNMEDYIFQVEVPM